jgi:integrase
MRNPSRPLKDIRKSWNKALVDAKIEYFWIYNLRHTFASRLSAAGVSDQFVAQIIGHSTTSILQTYVRGIDEYRRRAIQQLENLRSTQVALDGSLEFPIQEKLRRDEYKN